MRLKNAVLTVLITLAVAATTFGQSNQAIIPLGGNTWLTPNATALLNDNGLTQWSDNKDVINVYFRPAATGDINISLRLRVPAGSSRICVKILDKTLTRSVSNVEFADVDFGKAAVKKTGYIRLEIYGLEKTGAVFANISDLLITGTAVTSDMTYVRDNHGNFFYWGRRGPSIHLNYKVPAEVKNTTEWFYNEVTVPVGNDVVGSYFMADGFSGGYFGMQVNSATERRLLFSVWSPYTTDDPRSIPETYKVKLLKKGVAVHGGEFGGEGSGGQSYLVYPWAAGKTYCFLVHALGDIAAETTIFTAYFKPADAADWQLIASFKRPQSGNYLKGLHSFLENFAPDNGDKKRKVFFGNQWICDIEGKWWPLNDALFTGDETATINYRKDYAGGVQGDSFYLQNCGFFNDFVPLKASFTKAASAQKHPDIDFSKLP